MRHQPHHTSRVRRQRRGFTLMEMIVVVTIIALLATVIVPRLWQHVGKANVAAAKAEVSTIANMISTYLIDTGVPLDDDFDLSVLLLPADDGGGPSGPYLQKKDDLVDPWDHEYILRVPGEENFDFDVVSAGPDGELGTADDVTN